MGTPAPVTPDPKGSSRPGLPPDQSERRRRRLLACRIFVGVLILVLLLAGSYAVQSQPASLLAFLSPQGGEEEPLQNPEPALLNASVFYPRPDPSPLPSPLTAFSSPDFLTLSLPSYKPLPQVPSTAVDFLRPRPPLGVELVINLNKQRLTVVRYKKVILESPISSGRPSHPSTAGNFEVTQKDLHHYSTLYGHRVNGKYRPASMKYFVRYNGAEGLHAGALPGYPASHGCIRLPANKAAAVFKTVGVGTPVLVTRGSFHRVKGGPRKPAATARVRMPADSQAAPRPSRRAGPSLITEGRR